LQRTDLLVPDINLRAEFKQTGIGITDDGDGRRAYVEPNGLTADNVLSFDLWYPRKDKLDEPAGITTDDLANEPAIFDRLT